MKKFGGIIILSLFFCFYFTQSAENPVEPINKEKLQSQLNRVRRAFSKEFLDKENLEFTQGRLSPRGILCNSPAGTSPAITPQASSEKLLGNPKK